MPAEPMFSPAILKKMDEQMGIIRMISGQTAAGEDFYAYVSVLPSMYEEFELKIANRERMNVESYGKILHKGFGLEPSDDVKQYLEERYGIDHNFGANLVEALKEEVAKQQQAKK